MRCKWPIAGLILLGVATFLRADEGDDQTLTPYGTALLDYKSGHYAEARTAVEAAEKAKPDDLRTELLKAQILTELGQFDEADKLLKNLLATPDLTPAVGYSFEDALGDLKLRQRSFDSAAKIYEKMLVEKPNDPEIILKHVYASVGASDLMTAAKYASQLKPFDSSVDPLDPKHPGNPSYYFAKAALAEATDKHQEADNDIETARTLYGNILTDHYLKMYLEVFASSSKTPTSDGTSPTLVKPAPSGAKP